MATGIVRWLKPLVPVVSAEDADAISTVLIYPEHEDENRINYFTPHYVDKIIKDIQLGLTLTDSAIRNGLKPSTVQGWYNANRGNFRNVANKAVIDNKALHLGRVVAAKSMVGVKASAWILERKHREEYGKESTVNINRNGEEEQIFQIGDQQIKFQ